MAITSSISGPSSQKRRVGGVGGRSLTKEWRPEALRWYCLLPFAVLDLSVMVTIVFLAAKSRRENGFATVPDQTAGTSGQNEPVMGFLSISLDLGILWTVLPSAVLQLLSISWNAIARSLAARQPYVDLADARGAAAASSVLLDYQCTPTPWRWLRALRLGHTTVGLATLMGLILQYIATPFAARLFTTEAANARVAIVQGENPVPWANDEFAFRPFSATAPREGSYYMAANTTAYSAYVNCEVISDYTMSLERQEPESGDAGGVVRVAATDRGCEFSDEFRVSGVGSNIFFITGQRLDCSQAAHYSRFFFTAGQYAPASPYLLSNISVISCATDYQAVNGTLEVAVTSSSAAPNIRSFTRLRGNDTSNSVRRGTSWQVIERGMLNPVVLNPSGVWSTSEFGVTIVYVAEKMAGSEGLLAPAVLLEAISRVFTATYAMGMATGTFDPLEAEETVTGTVWTPATRLLVVDWAAYLIASLLLTVLVLSGWVSWHAYHTRSILTEEPEGLLAMAGLLDGSELTALVPHIQRQPGYDGRVRKIGKRLVEVKENAWVAESYDDGGLSGWRVMRKID
ncbi:hypothetical protein N658DRAFT_91095 [Parathielavia hyrcaniae]|uniref:Uncharacterized protein n=1 Tax=Parathielavia hyrcaniae TaxID=113614 RepID=A0AAN6T0U1_9PEZI|nr:hypothetical protein N658DRAFT_91095 [Parathielavia hyrcaniae]